MKTNKYYFLIITTELLLSSFLPACKKAEVPGDAMVTGDTLNVPNYGSGLIEVTKTQADSLIAADTLTKGAFYKINGVNPSLYNDGVDSGTSIVLQAIEKNKFSNEGKGIFYNPKYQNIAGFGVWSNRSTWAATLTSGTFNGNELITANNGATGQLFTTLDANSFIALTGSWGTATSIIGNMSGATATIASVVLKTYAIGSKAIWGGYSWTNVNGNTGAKTNILALNSEWAKDAYSTANYNISIDAIAYDYPNDWISRRYEAANDNEVIFTKGDSRNFSFTNSAISVFMFGNPVDVTGNFGVGGNHIINSYYECVDFAGAAIEWNMISEGSSIYNNTLSSRSNIYGNTLSGYSGIYNNNLHLGEIYGNTLSSQSNIYDNTVSYYGEIYDNTLNGISNIHGNTLDSSFVYENTISNQSSIYNNIISGGCSTHDNLLNGSSIYNNKFSDTSQIYDNTINGGSGIHNNTFGSSSYISLNTLNGGSHFHNNKFSNEGGILYNTFSNNSSIQIGISFPVVSKVIQLITAEKGAINVDVSAATIIFSTYPKTLYSLPDGTNKLRYYNNSGVMVIANVTD